MTGELNFKLPGPPIGYTDLLDYITEQTTKKEAGKKYGYPLRPSSSGKCARELAYQLAEHEGKVECEPELKAPNVKRLLDLGYYVELAVIKAFKALDTGEDPIKIRYKQQAVSLFKIPNGPLIEGNVDLVLWSDKYKCLMDVKSAKDNFSYIFKTKWDETADKLSRSEYTTPISETAWFIHDLAGFIDNYGDPFLNDNLYQLNAYGHAGFFQERGIDHCSILKYCKNDSRQYELRFAPSSEVFKRVKDKFTNVYTTISAGKAPEDVPRDYALGSVRCAFCQYNKHCWGKDSTAIKKDYFKTLPHKRWPKDIDRIDGGEVLEPLFAKLEECIEVTGKQQSVKQEIAKQMDALKVKKVKCANGNVYEAKPLKTGGPKNGPWVDIRRSKI